MLNTSGLTLIPVSIMVYRAQLGAAQPTDVFIPLLIATFFSTLAGIIATSLYQRIPLLNRTMLLTLGGLSAGVALLVWTFARLDTAAMNTAGTTASGVLLFSLITAFIVAGLRRRINVYDAFIEGAKGGFETAVRIIPYLVAMLVAIGVFRASGAMALLTDGMTAAVAFFGFDTQWVEALPTALMKPLSGSGSRGMMVDLMATHGPDAFVSRVSAAIQGSTDTMFYVLAVYFGSIGVRRTRYAVPYALLADLSGSVAGIIAAYIFFG